MMAKGISLVFLFLLIGDVRVDAFLAATSSRPHPAFFRLAAASSQPVIDWAKNETLEAILSKSDAAAIISELLEDTSLIDSSEEVVAKNWESLEERWLEEKRSVREILGEPTTQRLLRSVENVDYDPDAVRTFLGSDAINSLFAVVLYDAISEFTVKIDVFGNIVNSLPIIGPIRQQITNQFKQSLDRSLGPLIKNFLGAYTKVAVREAIDFVLSPENQKAFGSANVRLISSLLDRPVNSLIPSGDVSKKLRDDAFSYIRNDVNMDDVERYLDFVYDVLEDKRIDDVVDVDRVLEASPTLQKTLDTIWDKASKRSSISEKRAHE